MADKPILFSAPMVLALLAGTKTQTRRLLAPGAERLICRTCGCSEKEWKNSGCKCERGDLQWTPCDLPRYRVGDVLWVREAWQSDTNVNHLPPRDIPKESPVWYPADDGSSFVTDWSIRSTSKTRPGMFMPRWASRITLRVTEVRVQRLRDISRDEAIAEGIQRVTGLANFWAAGVDAKATMSPESAFAVLWDSLNAARAPWSSNPFVAAYTFDVRKSNIDKGAKT